MHSHPLTQGAQLGSGMLSQNVDPYIAAVRTGGFVDAINAVFQNIYDAENPGRYEIDGATGCVKSMALLYSK